MKITQGGLAKFLANLKFKQEHKVILLYGNEEALMLEHIHSVHKALPSYSFMNIDAENSSYLQEVSNEMLTNSIFGESKILHLHNFRKLDGRKITDILSKIDEKSPHILLLSHPTTLEATNSIRKFCEKTSHFISIGIYAETDASLKTTAKTLMDELHLHYDENIPMIISQMFTGNSTVMKQEIFKLHTYLLSDTQTITPQLLVKVLQEDSHSNVFEIPVMLFDKNIKKSLTAIENAQKHDISPVIVFTSISNYIKKLYNIKKALSKASPESIEMIMRKNGIFFQQADSIKRHTHKYNIQQMSQTISALNKLEIQTRNSTKFAYLCIKNFAINLC